MPSRMRSRAGRLIRKWGLLPGGVADGIGEDHLLEGLRLTSRVAVFFPDPPENLYQLRQWYRALERLHGAMGVTILTQDSRTAATVRAEVTVPVVVAAKTRTVGALLADGDVRVVLYVGQANANSVALRSIGVLHVFLNHGDSDKYVSVSNQVKAFDFAFVTGQAGIDRHANVLMLFDADSRTRVVGRPQSVARFELPTDARCLTVIYAPTWEGTHVVNAYSTVLAYGEQLVASLLAADDIHVIYRPHPRTGASDHRYRSADNRIRELIAEHSDRAEVDTNHDPSGAFSRAHVMIADVSAIGTDWLPQGRALVSTVPADERAQVAPPAKLFNETPHVDESSVTDIVEIVRAAASDPAMPHTIERLATYYLGGLDGVAALAAFIAACEEAAALCDAERRRLGIGA